MPDRNSYNQEDARNRSDFQSLVDRDYASLYRFAMSLTRSESDAADLVQETFLTWATKGQQLLDFSKARAWLFTTLHRCYLMSRRRTTRFPHVEIGEAELELPNVRPEVVNQLDAREMIRLLASVDSEFQAAVALFYLEDCSYKEISEILQIPIGTVKSRLARGLAQLKRLIRESSDPTKIVPLSTVPPELVRPPGDEPNSSPAGTPSPQGGEP